MTSGTWKNQGFFKTLLDTGLVNKTKRCESGKESKEQITVAFFMLPFGFKCVNLLLLERVKFQNAFKSCLILLNRTVSSIFIVKEDGLQRSQDSSSSCLRP